MKISTRGRYALRMMLDLAENQGSGVVALKDIAQRQDISKKYLEQIIPVLNRAGLLQTSRGFQGGYRLAKAPEDYTVGSILKLTEGGLTAVSCTSEGPAACSRSSCCETRPMWDKLDKMIDDFFESITLADLLKESDSGKAE